MTVVIESQEQLVALISQLLAQDDALRQDVAATFTRIVHHLESQPVTVISLSGRHPGTVQVVEADSLYELLGTQPAEDDIDWMDDRIRTDPEFRQWAAEDIAHAMNPTYPYTTDQESLDTAIRAALATVARVWGIER